jgi:hypothetical protein
MGIGAVGCRYTGVREGMMFQIGLLALRRKSVALPGSEKENITELAVR